MFKFSADLKIIGINPYVFVPLETLQEIFKQAGKSKGPIPVCGTINEKPYRQTLIKYSGHWRFYINTSMLKNSPSRIGEIVEIVIQFDPESRAIEAPEPFLKALNANPTAASVFNGLAPSRKFEILRYLARIKSSKILEDNITSAINFLHGEGRFVGRDKP